MAGIGVTVFRGDSFAAAMDFDTARTERGSEHVATIGLRWVW